MTLSTHSWLLPTHNIILPTQDESVDHGVDFLQDDNSLSFVLIVDLGELELLTHNRNNMTPEVVPNHMIRRSRQLTNNDDFINNVVDEDNTLKDYVDEDDSETDKESTCDEHLEYYSEIDDDELYYVIVYFCTF